jgi:hypothetical protein
VADALVYAISDDQTAGGGSLRSQFLIQVKPKACLRGTCVIQIATLIRHSNVTVHCTAGDFLPSSSMPSHPSASGPPVCYSDD